MDGSESLLFRNTFLTQEYLRDLSPEEREEFIRYAREIYNKKNSAERSLPSSSSSSSSSLEPNKIIDFKRNVLLVDSKYRNRILYPDANSFTYDFPTQFKNIVSIKLIESVVPNTDSVIKDLPESLRNNRIHWVNKEDDDLGYPVYSVALKPGNYDANSIAVEISEKMGAVKRRNGTGDYHVFEVSANTDTDVFSITQLVRDQLSSDPLTTTSGSRTVSVAQTSHGYATGDTIHISGASAVAGISASILNGKFTITKVDDDNYTYEVDTEAFSSTSGGGSYVTAASEAKFKLLWGDYDDTPEANLGFSNEDSSTALNSNPLETVTYTPTSIEWPIDISPEPPQYNTIRFRITSGHYISRGDQVIVTGVRSFPDINNKILTVYGTSSNSISVTSDVYIQNIDLDNVSSVVIKTKLLKIEIDDHEFNNAKIISNTPTTVNIQTTKSHNLSTGDYVWLRDSQTIPSIDGYHEVTVSSSTFFSISSAIDSTFSDNRVFIGYSSELILYGLENFRDGTIGGIETANQLNGLPLKYVKYTDDDHVLVEGPSFASYTQTGGGSNVRVTSIFNGFRGSQTNEKSSVSLNSPINLQGVDYVYLCSSRLEGTVDNNANIKNVFAVVLMNQPPGAVIYNSFVDNPKVYSSPLPVLNSMDFSVRNPDGSLYNFNGADFSFILEIIEVAERYKDMNISSRISNSSDFNARINSMNIRLV